MVRFRLGPRTVDLDEGTVVGGDQTVALTPTEVRLLRHLALRCGEVVHRDELLMRVWGYAPTVRTRTIDTTTSRLRAKLEEDPATPRFLHVLYGKGVRLDHVEPVVAQEAPFETRFFGAAQIVRLAEVVKRSRLTTVWGPAGVGKSRLAAEVVPRVPGAVAVGCAGVREARDLDRVVAEALGIERDAPRPWIDGDADVQLVLGHQVVVLVLDDCDDAVAFVGERARRWLAGAPRLRIVATSRVELRVPGEQLFEVLPLVPDDAVALFVDRARLRDPDYAPDPAQAARLVARVDHLPLAIELAAAQVHQVGVEALLVEPDARGALARAIEGGLDRLTPAERRGLAASSVFESPFDRADFAAVVAGPTPEAYELLDVLVRHSLVHVRDGLHRLYAPVRDRVRRELAADDPAHERHARWFARLGQPEALGRATREPTARAALLRATSDLAAAWRAASGVGDDDAAVGAGLGWLWCCARQGRVAVGLELADALAHRSAPREQRLTLGMLTATLWSLGGDERRALAALASVSGLAETTQERVRWACATATTHGRAGDRRAARATLAEVAPIAHRAASYAQYLGTLAFHSEPPDDEPRMREALAVARERSSVLIELECLGSLGWMAHARHADWDDGRRLFLRLIERASGNRNRPVAGRPSEPGSFPPPGPVGGNDALVRHRARAYIGLGELERIRGDLDAAENWLEQAAAAADRYGLADLAERARVELGRVWTNAGRLDDALGLVEPIVDAVRAPPHRSSGRALLALAEIREQLGDTDAAARLLLQVRAHATGAPADFAVEADDLLAVLLSDAARLAEPAVGAPAIDARRRALAAVLAARAGDLAGATVARGEAEAAIARLRLLPRSDAAVWLSRSRGTGRAASPSIL